MKPRGKKRLPLAAINFRGNRAARFFKVSRLHYRKESRPTGPAKSIIELFAGANRGGRRRVRIHPLGQQASIE